MNRIITVVIAILAAAFHAAASFDIPYPEDGVWPEQPYAAQIRRAVMPTPALATGAVQYEIPLYTLSVEGLEIPFSLRYLSNGIRVSDDPYPVGYGWTFLPALRATRIVRGRPDERYEDGGAIPEDMFGHAQAQRCIFTPQIDSPRLLDPQRDIISIHMPECTIGAMRVGDSLRTVGHDEYRLETDRGLTHIKVTDPNGRVWSFSQAGATDRTGGITEWGLDTVFLPSGRHISIEWGRHPHCGYFPHLALGQHYAYKAYVGSFPGDNAPHTLGPADSPENTNMLDLAGVRFPGGEIKLSYDDQAGSGSVVRRLSVRDDGGREVASAEFERGPDRRLLGGVKLGDGSRYTFSYNSVTFGANPPFDLWGYNNVEDEWGYCPVPAFKADGIGEESVIVQGLKRMPDSLRMRAFMLERVTLPTGGSLEWECEPHRFEPRRFNDIPDFEVAGEPVLSWGGGLRVKTVKMRESEDAEPVTRRYVYGQDGCGMATVEALPTLSTFVSTHMQRYGKWSDDRCGVLKVLVNSTYTSHLYCEPLWYGEVREYSEKGFTAYGFCRLLNSIVGKPWLEETRPVDITTTFSKGPVESSRRTYRENEDGTTQLCEEAYTHYEVHDAMLPFREVCVARKLTQYLDPEYAPDFPEATEGLLDNTDVPIIAKYKIAEDEVYRYTHHYLTPRYEIQTGETLIRHCDNGVDIVRKTHRNYKLGTSILLSETLTDGVDSLKTEYVYADSPFYADSLTSYRVSEMVAANAVGTVLGARQTFRGSRQSWHTLNDRFGSAFRPIRVYRRRGDGPAWHDGLYQWNTDGTLLSHSGTDNIRTSWTWDSHGRYPLSRQTGDPGSGPSLTERLEWKPLVGVSAYVDAAGVRTEYGYDGACRLASVRIGGDLRQAYAYTVSRSGNSRISSRTYTSASAYAESVERFDGLGRPRASFVPSPGGMAATLTQYDTAGRPWRQWSPAPVTSDAATDTDIMSASVDYHNDGMPYTETAYEPSSRELATAVTNSGELWHSSGRSSSVRRLANDGGAHACPRYRLTPSGVEYQGNYPPGLLEVEETADEDGTVAETYTDLRGLTVMTRRAGLATVYVYNDYGELCWVLPPAMAKNRSYDAGDKEADDYAYRYEYDATGLLTSKKLPGRAAVQYRYDTARRPSMERDGLTGDAWRIRLYDRLGREVVTGMAYWPESQVREYLSNAKGFVYAGGESCAGYEHCGYRPPITVISSRRYNGLGQPVWEGNQTAEISCTYDRLGRVSSRTTTAWFGTSCEQYSYTYTGNPSETLTTVTADTTVYPSTRVVYTYDTADRLVKTEAYRGGSSSPAVLTTTYDAVGRVARTGLGQAYRRHSYDVHGWPDSTVTYLEPLVAGHTPGGNPVLFRAAAPGTYPPLGDSLEIDRPVVVFPPDTARLDSIRPEIARRRVTERLLYAAGKYPCFNGNISAKADRRGRYDYRYDNAGRLVAAEFTPSGEGGTEDYSTGYAYDANSNLTALTRHGVTDITGDTRTYGVLDRLDYTLDGNRPARVESSGEGAPYRGRTGMGSGGLDGSWEFAYDANGNVTRDGSRGITGISYNHANQATDIWLSDGWRVVNSYGPDGTKLRSALASPEGWGVTVRKYLGNLVIEDDRVVQQLFPGGYFDAEGNAYYYLTDYQGNVTGVIDSHAKVIQETGYYPYGEPWLEPDGDNSYLYGGKERMALGGVRYSDFGPRLLSTASGYWGSPDPLCEDNRDLSPYINCAANPVRLSDPSGLSPVYNINGDSLGCTKEGFTGEILIYSGEGTFDPSNFTADDLYDNEYIDSYDRARLNRGILSADAHSKIWTSVVKHYEGMKIFGESFSLAKIDGNKIHFDSEIDKAKTNWTTEFYPNDPIPPVISGNAAFQYEGTVENIASSIIVHEWYSHGVCHVCDERYNHWVAYFNVICCNPLWGETTIKYQKSNLNNFATYYINESLGLQYRSNFLINK